MMIRYLVGMFIVLFIPAPLYAAEWIDIPAGKFLMGSTVNQIKSAYHISAAGYGHDEVREAGWFNHESPQKKLYLPRFRIQKTPVTQAEYARFIKATHRPAPNVDARTWLSYGLAHPYSHVQPYLWHNGQFPAGKADHPVVLVSFQDAHAYAQWLSKKLGRDLHLANSAQWEKAMRGVDGRQYPWGEHYKASHLNNIDQGPAGTTPVGSNPAGASPFGVLDAAGQVFEWTESNAGIGKKIVKGGSWDDHGGVCRPAAFHARPASLKHILIGFRLVEGTVR